MHIKSGTRHKLVVLQALALVFRRALAIVAGVSLGGICFFNSADAGNAVIPYINVSNCLGCKLSTDFVSAATANAKGLGQPGTYIAVSSTNAETAFVQITGTTVSVKGPDGPELTLTDITSTLIDGSGNPLAAGSSESTLESDFNNFDQVSFGTNRAGSIGYVTVPDDYQSSFINSDLTDTAGQIPGWINNQYHTTQIPVGTVVTLVYTDGTKAQFIKISASGSIQFEWNQLAWKMVNGLPVLIHLDGSPVTNSNTSGTGAGSATATPVSGNFAMYGEALCVTSTSVTWGGVYQGSETHYVPC